jgi:hypothetical protein
LTNATWIPRLPFELSNDAAQAEQDTKTNGRYEPELGADRKETQMSAEMNEGVRAREDEFAIVINGELALVPHEAVSYEEVVSIAFPVPPEPGHCQTTYTVAYSHAASQPHEGFLAPGKIVEAKQTGTEFDVSPTGKS